MQTNTCVLIADDHMLVREGLRLLVASLLKEARFLEAHDADSLFTAARNATGPLLLLTDLMMPGMDKGERLVEVSRAFPKIAIVVISALTSPDIVRRALALDNVFAFVSKSGSAVEMGAALNAAWRREKLPWSPVPVDEDDVSISLSPRLAEVRLLLRQGLSNKMIAGRLGISEGTVKNYMSEIFRVLRVSNRTQAAQFNPDNA